MNRIVPFLLFALALWLPQLAFANSMVASVNKTKVSKNEIIQLTIRADFSLDGDALDFSTLNKDFFVSGPRFSSSSRFINGQSSQLSEWTLSIAPNRAGYLTIPAFSAQGVSSEPIVLEVTIDQQAPKQQDIVQYSLQMSHNTLYPQQSTQLKTEIRILADPRRLDNPRIVPPTLQGMALEAVGQSRQFQRVENGLQVTVVEQHYRLTAQNPGQFELIGPRLTGAYIYGDSLTGSTKVLTLDAPAMRQTITVKAIPAEAAKPWLPAAQLTLEQSWSDGAHSTQTVEQGSSITREIRLTAQGINADMLPSFNLDYPSSVRVYSEKPIVTEQANGLVQMTLKQVLIPAQTGEITLPSVQLDWWNTQTDQAQRAFLEGRQVTITPSTAQVFTLADSAAAEQAAPITSSPTSNGQVAAHSPLWIYLTGLFAGLWLITALLAAHWFRRCKTLTTFSTQSTTTTHDSEQTLEQCLASGDAIQIEARVRAWIKQHHPNSERLGQIEHELNLLHRAVYSDGGEPWQPKRLMALLKQNDPGRRQNDLRLPSL